MNPELNYTIGRERHSDLLREAQQHRLAAFPPKERRLPLYGARLLAAVRAHSHVATLRPSAARG